MIFKFESFQHILGYIGNRISHRLSSTKFGVVVFFGMNITSFLGRGIGHCGVYHRTYVVPKFHVMQVPRFEHHLSNKFRNEFITARASFGNGLLTLLHQRKSERQMKSDTS